MKNKRHKSKDYKGSCLLYEDKIKELYESGLSCADIKETLNILVTVRSIQRFLKEFGQSRPREVALSMARAREKQVQGIHKYWNGYEKCINTTLGRGTRYKILKRDNFKCVLCGRDATDGVKLTVDHIVPNKTKHYSNTDLKNLRTLCFECNIGRNNVDYLAQKREVKE